MLSVTTARTLRSTGLVWRPANGDRFVIADRGMDGEVFVLSDLTIEAYDFPTGKVLGFNGTTEWALDSVQVEQALWLPREEQLREALGESFAGLRRGGQGWSVGVTGATGATGDTEGGADGGADGTIRWTSARDAEEAYGLALLARRAPGDVRALLPVAAEGFGARVHAVPDGGWDAAAPLPDWSVRDLVNHLVGEHLWVPHLLGGGTVAGAGERFDGDLAGGRPSDAWDEAVAGSLQAWVTAGDEDVHLSSGPTPVREYAAQMLLDLTVHAWDLAQAGSGADRADDRLDPACVDAVLGYVLAHEGELRGSGVFGPPVPTASDDPQDRLLALLGRDPGRPG